MDRWVGKTAVVTGASVGIGARLVVELAEAGVNVVGLAKKTDKIDKLESQVKSGKGKITSFKCDVSQPDDITKAFKHVNETFGSVDILVNNAGVLLYGQMTDATPENIKAVFDTNVTGLILCTNEAVRSMERSDSSGHIINMNSFVGHCVPHNKCLQAYVPSKWAVTAATDVTRNDITGRKSRNKIKISSISIGLLRKEIYETAGIMNELYNHHPHIDTKDVVDAIMYVLGTPPSVEIKELMIGPIGEIY